MSTDPIDTDGMNPRQLAAAIRGEELPAAPDPDEMDPIKLAEAIRPSRRNTSAPDADDADPTEGMTPAEIAAAIPRY